MKNEKLINLEQIKNDASKTAIVHVQVMPIKNGYGWCRSCGCKGYRPNQPKNEYCKDCGHHYSRHA